MTINKRRLTIRLICIILLILLGVWMYFLGREHTILVDNKTIGDIKAFDLVSVQVDDQEPVELTKRGRDQFIVQSQKHTLKVTYTDKNWNETTKTWTFSVPAGWDMALVSIPYLASNPDAPQSEWMSEFVIKEAAPKEEDNTVDTGDSFAM